MHLTMDQYHLELSCVSLVPRPKQSQWHPARITSSISREILEVIHAGAVWVWEQDYSCVANTMSSTERNSQLTLSVVVCIKLVDHGP